MVVTSEMLKERVGYLGGSDASGILGLSRWKTPLQVFMSKVYPNHDESETCIGGKNEAAYWGNKLEDKVAEAFTEKTGKKVYRVNETLIHPEHDFIRANIDRRVVGEDAVLECKTASAYKAQEWAGEDIPAEYILQVMHYLAVTGKDKAYIAVLIGGQKFIWKEVQRDEALIKQILDAEISFWNDFVLTKTPPMVTGSERDGDLLNRLYTDSEPEKTVIFPDEFDTLLKTRDEYLQKVEDLEKSLTYIDNRLKETLKEAEAGTIGNYVVTWKGQSRTSVDAKVLKETYPEAFEKCQKTSSFRVLRIKEKKEKKNG